jgi:hypothetical protein
MFKMSSNLIRSLMDTSRHGLSHAFKRPRGLWENVLADIKNALVKSLFIFIWAQYTRVYKCLHRKTHQGINSTSCWFVPRKVSVREHRSIRNIFLCFSGKLNSKLCQSVLGTSCIQWCKLTGHNKSRVFSKLINLN